MHANVRLYTSTGRNYTIVLLVTNHFRYDREKWIVERPDDCHVSVML